MYRLPPLNALRVFEAVARHENFSRAAAELCVTHGAVSKQISALEKWLGLKLFERTPGGVVMTRAGRAYRGEIAGALERIAAATSKLLPRDRPDTLHISAPPTFAAKWLLPRLPEFRRRNPFLEIRLKTRRDNAVSSLRGSDIVIRRGPDVWRGVYRRLFLEEAITPVCHPRLLRDRPLRSPAELRQYTWLYADVRAADWEAWLVHAAAAGLVPEHALRFDHSSLALKAAVDGMGIAMGPRAMIRDELETQQLCMPFPRLIAPTPGYYAICSRKDRDDPKIGRFCDWLEDEGVAPRNATAARR